MQHFLGEAVSDSGDGTDCTTANEAMANLGIDPHHQQHVMIG